jgi:preprotein translocase subunit SecD
MLNATRLVPATLLLLQLACAACRQEPPESRAAPACPSLAVAELAVSTGTGKPLPTPDGRAVSVLDPPVLATRDVAGARLGEAEGRQVLELELEQEGAARLRAYTASHVGSQLAFVVDGRVRQVMRVLDPIVGKGLMVDPGDPTEIAALAHALGDGRCSGRR